MLRSSGFHTNRQRVVIHAMATRAAVYIAVFIYCWTPGKVLQDLTQEPCLPAFFGMLTYFRINDATILNSTGKQCHREMRELSSDEEFKSF